MPIIEIKYFRFIFRIILIIEFVYSSFKSPFITIHLSSYSPYFFLLSIDNNLFMNKLLHIFLFLFKDSFILYNNLFIFRMVLKRLTPPLEDNNPT